MARAALIPILIALLGCSASAGGWSFCFLDHADLTVRVAHPHADPNAAP